LGLIDDSWRDEHAMDRGTAVHLATQFYDEGDLDEASVSAEVRPYLDAYRKWRREMPEFEIARKPELKVANPGLDITGTLDRIVAKPKNNWLIVVDIKTGAPAPWHRWQIALYRLLYALQEGGGTPLGAALYLSADGTYKWIEYKDRTDPDRARALIAAAHIKKECES
jgi:hypothetical protein